MPESSENIWKGEVRCLHYLSAVRLEDGGVVRAVLDLCGVLASHGHQVTLLTSDGRDIPSSWQQKSRSIDGVPRVVVIDHLRRLGRLTGTARREAQRLLADADVLHLHTPWDPVNLAMASQARKLQVPYVLTPHGMLDDWSMAQRGWKKRLYLTVAGRRLLEQAALVHCTAEDERRQASRWYPRGRSYVVPCLIDLDPFEHLPGADLARRVYPELTAGPPTLLFLSRLHPKKGVEVLIDAAAILRDRGCGCTTFIAGPGEDRYVAGLRERIERKSLSSHVHLLGMVSGQLKYSLYQASDLFVLPTSQENFGLVLTESLACGTPVVTTRGVDIWRELEAAGAVIVDQAPEAIAGAIESFFLRDMAALGEKGRQWVLSRFEPTRLVNEYVTMYSRAAAADSL